MTLPVEDEVYFSNVIIRVRVLRAHLQAISGLFLVSCSKVGEPLKGVIVDDVQIRAQNVRGHDKVKMVVVTKDISCVDLVYIGDFVVRNFIDRVQTKDSLSIIFVYLHSKIQHLHYGLIAEESDDDD